MPAFIRKTIQAVSLKIRSGLVMAGACQGVNCLNPLWARSALCSDKCFLCFPEKSDLLKRLACSFSFFWSPHRQLNLERKKYPHLSSSPSSSELTSFPAVPSLWGAEATLRRVWTPVLIISSAGCAIGVLGSLSGPCQGQQCQR